MSVYPFRLLAPDPVAPCGGPVCLHAPLPWLRDPVIPEHSPHGIGVNAWLLVICELAPLMRQLSEREARPARLITPLPWRFRLALSLSLFFLSSPFLSFPFL